MATTNPEPSSEPARNPNYRGILADADQEDVWEARIKRLDETTASTWERIESDRLHAAEAQQAPAMVTGYCRLCAAGYPASNGAHYEYDEETGRRYNLGPCTGEHAPGLQARPTQYCFWCLIGSPTDERGQHHVDGDIHQCTGQQVTQAQPAEAGDESLRNALRAAEQRELTALSELDAARAELAKITNERDMLYKRVAVLEARLR